MKESQHRVLKDCRQQLRAQLYQQRENIHFDPVLQTSCTTDIKQYCFNVEPGNSQVATVSSNIKWLSFTLCIRILYIYNFYLKDFSFNNKNYVRVLYILLIRQVKE